MLLSARSDTEAYFGRLNKARDYSRRAVDSALRADSKETASLWQANAALREAEFGNAAAARQGVTSALAITRGRDVKVLAALALARIGDTAQAKALIDELARTNPNNTVLKLYWMPVLKAAIELNGGKPEQAIVLLEAALPYELGRPPPIFVGSIYPAYLRGIALLAEKNGAAAQAEFQKLIEHRGIIVNFPLAPFAYSAWAAPKHYLETSPVQKAPINRY